MKMQLYFFSAATISFVLFLLMVLSFYIGTRLAHRKKMRQVEDDEKTSSSLVGAVFALSAFVLGFAFSMSASRYDAKRNIVVQEANNIGTALLRADLYPDSMRNIIRPLFKEYIETRIDYYNTKADTAALNTSLIKANAISAKIWQEAIGHFNKTGAFVPVNNMLPALNAMIDITTTSHQQLYAVVPQSILMMLFILTLTSAFLAGYSNKKGHVDWPIAVGFCLLSSLVIYCTLDLDRPNRGLITLDTAKQAIVDLRKNF
jgi:hypothetical protein